MGRIEDALRRAAEKDRQQSEGLGRVATGVPEAFPLEELESEAVPSATAVAGPAVPATPPVAALPEVASNPLDTPDTPGSLMQRLSSTLAEKVVVDVNTAQVSREQYRKLAATLHQTQALSGLKVVMIASAVAGEGKTLTSSNLALTLSESYKRRVLLIDGDLRRPSLHTIFRVDGTIGLSEGLISTEERRFPVHEVSTHLTMLPAGRPTLDPMAGLTSDRMRRLIEEARAAFDWVIVDTPPVGLLPDGHLLTSMVDGVVLVVKAGETPYPVVQRALASLGRERILGVVLNQAPESSAHSYYSYRYEYGSRPEIAAP
jgi:capsular exopolysaccharide synthesis family protein